MIWDGGGVVPSRTGEETWEEGKPSMWGDDRIG